MLPVNATHQIAVLGVVGIDPINLNELQQMLPIPRAALIAATGRLVSRGFVERREDGLYALSDSGIAILRDGLKIGGDAAKRRKEPIYIDSLRQRAWKAMQLLGRFKVGDVAIRAARDEVDAEDSIRRFCHALTKAGYLIELAGRAEGTAPSSNGFKVWQLVRNTGEHAPQYMAKRKAFRDRNTREVFPCR